MSVIVAIKEEGVVYMGADTQTTAGQHKYNHINDTAFKVLKLENGILVGFCGRVAARQTILSTKGVFTLDSRGELTKKHIVKEIVPKLVDKMEQIGVDENGAMDVSLLVAHKDKLYRITVELDVIALNEYGVAGAGMNYTYYALSLKDLPVRERLLKALIESAKRSDSVGGPYLFIDTKKLEYEVIDMGVNNH